ncbi:hypothetical protein [Alkalinema sp. FACHB-956]|nr:hypothetical protein [Alkalinema sp. FACHB-956]MBD2326177.1 hypothetical protein [Alkalinema sp. FACHB-956]
MEKATMENIVNEQVCIILAIATLDFCHFCGVALNDTDRCLLRVLT